MLVPTACGTASSGPGSFLQCLHYSSFSRFQGPCLPLSAAPPCPRGSCKRHPFGLLVRIPRPVLPQHGLICVSLTALNPIRIYSPRDHPSLPSPRRTRAGFTLFIIASPEPSLEMQCGMWHFMWHHMKFRVNREESRLQFLSLPSDSTCATASSFPPNAMGLAGLRVTLMRKRRP